MVASDTEITTAGNAEIFGTVLIMGAGNNLKLNMSTGTAAIYGQVITEELVIDNDTDFEVRGNADVNYSSAAKAKAQEALINANPGGGGAILTVAWTETY